MTTVICGRDIKKTYRGDGAAVDALRGISLTVIAREFVALTGPSGCGKSTLLNILACVDRATSGSVEIAGRDVSTLDDDRLTAVRRTTIGYVFQFFNLLPALTVAENVALPLVLAGAKREAARTQVDDALSRVGLAGIGDRRPGALSGGQQQRAAIARAIVHRPAIVLADEPIGNLDSATGREILELLRALAGCDGTTILMATHSADASAAADRVICMRDGVIEN
ncbi:MAG TPA: ABC transporter ATP-binding protein [Candidatus Eremiobacteraceae bacterium]|nr:ABC transporter ATP-binding protein [Candidatus Eremiobacteraceae bacterium]